LRKINHLESANINDILFSEERISGHPDDLSTMYGYKPVKLLDYSVPVTFRIAYIIKKTPKSEEPVVYIVDSMERDSFSIPLYVDVENEDAARIYILKKLLAYLMSAGTGGGGEPTTPAK